MSNLTPRLVGYIPVAGEIQEAVWQAVLSLQPGDSMTSWMDQVLGLENGRKAAASLRTWLWRRRQRMVAVARQGMSDDFDLSSEAARRTDPLAGLATYIVEERGKIGLRFHKPEPRAWTIIVNKVGQPPIQVWPPQETA